MNKLIPYLLLFFVSCGAPPAYTDVYAQVTTSHMGTTVSTAGSVHARSSRNFVAGRLYMMVVWNLKATTPEQATLSGTSQTWDLISTQTGSTTAAPTLRVSVYRFYATTTFSAGTNVIFSAAQDRTVSVLFECDGVAPSTNNGANNIVQVAAQAADGETASTLTMLPVSNKHNAMVAIWGSNAAGSATPESGWTEEADVSYPAPDMWVYYMKRQSTTDNTPSITMAASMNVVKMAFEIRAEKRRIYNN